MKLLLSLLFAVTVIPGALWAQGGAIKVTTTIHSDGTQTILKTDPDALLAESRVLDASQKLLQRTVYSMNEQGHYTDGSIYDGNGKLLMKSVYTRDAANRVTEQSDYSPDEKLVRKIVFEYDTRGKVARVRTFDPAGNEITPVKKQGSRSGPKR